MEFVEFLDSETKEIVVISTIDHFYKEDTFIRISTRGDNDGQICFDSEAECTHAYEQLIEAVQYGSTKRILFKDTRRAKLLRKLEALDLEEGDD